MRSENSFQSSPGPRNGDHRDRQSIAELRMQAATHGGDCSDQLAKRAEKAEALLRQIAVNTDAVWARQQARDYFGMGPFK